VGARGEALRREARIAVARLAAAFGSSHSVMLGATLEDWLTGFRVSDLRMPYYDGEGRRMSYADVLARAPGDAAKRITSEIITARFHEVQAAMERMAAEIAQAKLDVLVIVGDDQYELFHDEHMPAIALYYGETIRNATKKPIAEDDWYRRAQNRRLEDEHDAHYPCHRPLALHLIEALIAREFDVSALAALSGEQYEGHAYSFVHRRYLQDSALRIVPVFLNTYNPPNAPLPKRCLNLGSALKDAIAAYREDLRVGILASGGLSHFVVDESMDRAIIEALRRKDHAFLAALDPRTLKGGSSEIRNWIVVAAAAAELHLSWVSYTPAYRTPALTGTGLCFARWS
jgi:Catalytic LigB subunit of aromatic ring-opening dioxygenase